MLGLKYRFAIIDLETTGLSPDQGDQITEIGVVLLENDQIIERFETLVNPGCPIPFDVQEMTGITDEMVSDAPNSKIALAQAMDLVRDTPLVAHNASFERRFLKKEFCKFSRKNEISILCTILLSRRLFPNMESYRLGDLVSQFNLPESPAHRALSDAEMTAHLFVLLRKRLFEFSPERINFSADTLFKICKTAPKTFRELGIKEGIAISMKKHAIYMPHKFNITPQFSREVRLKEKNSTCIKKRGNVVLPSSRKSDYYGESSQNRSESAESDKPPTTKISESGVASIINSSLSGDSLKNEALRRNWLILNWIVFGFYPVLFLMFDGKFANALISIILGWLGHKLIKYLLP